MHGGWIYLLISSQDYSRCKVGRTSGNPLARFRQLRTADPYLGLVAAYYIPSGCGQVSAFEASIHYEFQDHRIFNHDDSKTEWFRIDYKQSEMLIDGMLEEWCEQQLHCTFHPDKLCKLYEEAIRFHFEPHQADIDFAKWILDGPSG